MKQVTEAVWLASSQMLRHKAEAERAASARLGNLQKDRESCMEMVTGEGETDGAVIVSAARWMRWSEKERARLNMDLARVRADLAKEQEVARKSFAKDQALDKLLRQMPRNPKG
ncbi:hypothetical protein R3X27_00150 [Tropicimonas sp. TH_r6]|uniref:hypothetical protein n=1 Tax=Tropicimonas sp. TH_r6 TaxID=3082085 RepID=UPI002952F08C|nr:hypothetical protein [Tropicimonas sp. TH_r6]MDV7141080.1 hypothetical protein [Tropicimonas sp. TH_r6]